MLRIGGTGKELKRDYNAKYMEDNDEGHGRGKQRSTAVYRSEVFVAIREIERRFLCIYPILFRNNFVLFLSE